MIVFSDQKEYLQKKKYQFFKKKEIFSYDISMTFRLSPLHIFLILLGVILIGYIFYNTWESFQGREKEGFASWGGTDVTVKKYGSDEGISVSNILDTTYFDPGSSTLFELSANTMYLTLQDGTTKTQVVSISDMYDYFNSLNNTDSGNVIIGLNLLKTSYNTIPCTNGNCIIDTTLQRNMYNIMGNTSASTGNILSILNRYPTQNTNTAQLQMLFPNNGTPTGNITLTQGNLTNIGTSLFHDTTFYTITKPSIKKNYTYQTKNGKYIFIVFPIEKTSVTFIHIIDRPGNKHFKSLYYMGNEMQIYTYSNKNVSTSSVTEITSQTGGSSTSSFSGDIAAVQYEGTSGLLKVMTSHDTTKQQVLVGLCYDTLAIRAYIQITSSGATVMKSEASNSISGGTSGNTTSDNNFNVSLGNGINFSVPSSFLFSFFNSSLNSNTLNSDFIKKTQVVPPVCPSCPSCIMNAGSGVCTNCGGNGGSGTQGTQGSQGNTSVTNNNGGQIAADLAKGFGTGVKETVGGAVDLGKEAVGGTVGLARDTVGGTIGLAKDTVGGAVGLTKDAVGGVGKFLEDTGSGVGKFIQSSASGLGEYAKGAVSGVANAGQGYGQGYGQGQGQGQGQSRYGMGQYGGSDPYSYYGTLPNRPATNFMPVTADFSKFGR